MLDEKDVAPEKEWLYEALALKVVDRLKKNYFNADYASDRKEALNKVITAIPEGATIGTAGSVTLHQIGFYSWLETQPQHVVFNPALRNADGESVYTVEERYELMRKALTAGVFLTGSNAVTLDGKLVNTDGRGNRVAAMIWGPKKTILVVGANKIVKDVDEAIMRIKSYCAPLDAKRHVLKHHWSTMEKLPCVATGVCADCNSPARICCKTVIIEGQNFGLSFPAESGISVIMVGESLGF